MTPEIYRTNFRWFTSELSFASVADMIRAKREIEQLYGKPIITEPANYDIHFSGKFDLADLPADNPITLQSILKKYVNQSYRIKNVFSESNGFFGGWVGIVNCHNGFLMRDTDTDLGEVHCELLELLEKTTA